MAWLALVLSGLLELVWATAFAASEGFARPLPVFVFLVAFIASGVGLGYAIRTVRVVLAFVVWAVITGAVTAIWAFLTGVDVSSVVVVAVLGVALGSAVGLHLVYRRRALATSPSSTQREGDDS
ncbi:DMT family transporter [Isoptericola haloaureus]|uniref:SMR family transporter n=1 Tax=Isoptericola haloaureus TaxID=1542902 RepID=A0ABU7Z3G6_9MICO